jgi:class 3 adenylate cyclase/tetratricopeptide (TPR) repeat protein
MTMTAPDTLSSGDRRSQITIVFTDVSNSTTISSTMEPEEYGRLIDRVREIVSDVFLDHGATIVRIDGDGFIFIFGHPVIQEHATQRAVKASLEAHRQVTELGRQHGLGLHTGIHTGVVLARTGDLSRGQYEILGEPTNLTARLCENAKAEEIIVSTEALGADRHLFDASDPVAIKLKGRRQPMYVRYIHGLQEAAPDVPTRVFRPSAPFIGRENELGWLRNCVAGTGEAGRIGIVEAEAGMGKTRLLFEFLKEMRAAGHAAHWGHCEAYLGTAPLQPIAQLVASILQDTESMSAPGSESSANAVLNRIQGVAEGQAVSVADDAVRTLAEEMKQLIQSIASGKPVVLCIDDWHWADNASKAVLGHLMSLPNPGVTFLLATRKVDPFFSAFNVAELLPLQPLSAKASGAFVGALVPDLDPFVAKNIFEYSGGNPLFTEELCHAAEFGDRPFLPANNDAWLRTFTSNRFMRLPSHLAAILKTASVVGHTVPLELLKSANDEPVDERSLRDLQDRDFLFPGETPGNLRFKHRLTREAIYSLISLDERQACHKRVADALRADMSGDDRPDDHGQLAYHSLQFGDIERAIVHAMKAGEMTLANSALDKAQFYFQVALDAIARQPEYDDRLRTAIRNYGRACIVDPNWEQTGVLERGIGLATRYQDTVGIAWGKYWLAFILYGLGEPRQAVAQFKHSYSAAQDVRDHVLLRQMDGSLGEVHAAACEYERAFFFLNRSIETKTANRSGDRPSISLAYALSCKGFALGDQGKFDEAYRLFGEALDVMGRPDHEVCISIIAHKSAVHLWQGEFDQTIDISGQTLQLAERMRSRYHYAMSHALMGAAEFYLSRDENALSRIEKATEWMTLGGSQQYISLAWGYLANGYAETGNTEKARKYAAQAILRGRKGDRLGEAIAYRALARLESAGRRGKDSDYYLSRALKASELRQSSREKAHTLYLQRQLSGRGTKAAAAELTHIGIDVNRFYAS